ncbi:hypothetical protein GVAV_001304 [Gurleya vavrai]
MFDEHIKVMEIHNKKFNEIERSFEDKFVVFFECYHEIFAFDSIKSFQESLYNSLSIKKSNNSIMAVKFFDLQADDDDFSSINLKHFFDEIQKSIREQKKEIVEQEFYESFGIIIELNYDIYYKNSLYIENEFYINENFNVEHAIYSNDRKDFEFTKQSESNHLCFLSNYIVSQEDFQYCTKIYDTQRSINEIQCNSLTCLI